jgi:hypothetical protein
MATIATGQIRPVAIVKLGHVAIVPDCSSDYKDMHNRCAHSDIEKARPDKDGVLHGRSGPPGIRAVNTKADRPSQGLRNPLAPENAVQGRTGLYSETRWDDTYQEGKLSNQAKQVRTAVPRKIVSGSSHVRAWEQRRLPGNLI